MGGKEITSLAKKLGIQPEDRVGLIGAPAKIKDLLRQECPPDVIFEEGASDPKYRMILFWPKELSALVQQFTEMQNLILPDGAIWVIIPKKKFVRKWGIDFSWEQMQAAGLRTDLVDNKVASIDEESYGTRFVIRKEKRGKYSVSGSEQT
jgi:hypothetical protein